MPTVRIMRIRHQITSRRVGRRPLGRAGRTLGQFPLIAKQHIEIAVVPFDRVWCPCAFKATCCRVNTLAGAKIIAPAKPLFLNACAFRFWPDKAGITGTVCLAKSMTTSDQRHSLFIIHGHAGKCLADIAC